MVRRMDRHMVQEMFWLREAKNGAETDELLQTGTDGHPRVWQNVQEDPSLGRRQDPGNGRKKLEHWRTKREELREKSIRGF